MIIVQEETMSDQNASPPPWNSVPPDTAGAQLPQEDQTAQETVVVSTEIPQGGITFDPQSTEQPLQPPLQDSGIGNEQGNPFIPQVETKQSTRSNRETSGGGAKQLLVIAIVIFFLAGLAALGWFMYQKFTVSKEVTITYWGLWEPDSVLQGVIDDFEEKNQGVTITYVKQSPRQYRERLQASISRGEGPDVFRFHNTWVAMLAPQLAPIPKTVMSAAEFSSTFYPVATSDLVAEETLYGIPLMIDGLGLYINEDLFAQALVAPPTTWEDVLRIVPKLTVKEGNTIKISAIALGEAGNVEHFSDIIVLMLMQNGASPVTLAGKEAEETLLFYRKFSDPTDPMYTWDKTLDNSVVAFAAGRVAMMLAPSWRVFDVQNMNPNLRFRIVPVPQLPGNVVNWASYWVEGVSNRSKAKDQAFAFLRYISNRETMTRVYTEAAKTRAFGEVYSRVDLADTVAPDPFVGAFVSQGKTARSFPLSSYTYDNGLNDKLIKYLEDAINSVAAGSSPRSALATAANGFRQVLNQYGLTTSSAPPASQ